MLILSRRAEECIYIYPIDNMPDISARELFAAGPITIALISSGQNFARIGIDAPGMLSIVRDDVQEE